MDPIRYTVQISDRLFLGICANRTFSINMRQHCSLPWLQNIYLKKPSLAIALHLSWTIPWCYRATWNLHIVYQGKRSPYCSRTSHSNHANRNVCWTGYKRCHHVNLEKTPGMTAQPGVVADRSRLQEGYRSMGRGKGRFRGARKRAGS